MENQPRFAKAHSELVAAEYQRLGWTLITTLRAAPGIEPYEYLLEWMQEGPPLSVDWEELQRRSKAAPELGPRDGVL